MWIDSGLHASEVATAQHAIRLAHQVATDESPEMQAVRDNVLLVLAPCINPDGMNMVVDWYRRTLRTPHQDSPMPWLYQKYVGHDNNRDGYMQTQKETQVVNRLLFAEWLPQIMYNQHQGTYPPRIFVPPFPDPVNPNIDPQIVRGVDLVGGAMQDRFEREGKDGVISRYAFSIWYNGSVRTTSYFHNIIGILTETGHASATPFTYDASRFPPTLSNGVATLAPSVTYPNPWKGGTLHLRDAVEYMLTGSLAVLEVAAKYRERFLYGIYQVGARQIAKGQTEAPVAYVVPIAPARSTRQPGVHRHADERRHRGAPRGRGRSPPTASPYPEGTHVVLLAQPFRPFAKDLLERQSYPDLRAHADGPPLPPYDVAGWTLSYQMGVQAVPVAKTFDTTALVPLDSAPEAAGEVDAAPGSHGVGLRHRSRGERCGNRGESSPRPGRGGRTGWPRPSARVRPSPCRPAPGWSGAAHRANNLCASWPEALGLRTWSLDRAPAQRLVPDTRSPHRPVQELGGEHGRGLDTMAPRAVRVPLHDPDRPRHPRRRAAAALRCHRPAAPEPERHRPRPRGRRCRPGREGPSNPVPPEYQGGIGDVGRRGAEAFRRPTVAPWSRSMRPATWRSSASAECSGGSATSPADSTAPSSTARDPCCACTWIPASPSAWGMPSETAAYFQGSRAFDTANPSVRSIARYASTDDVLMSGWLLGGRPHRKPPRGAGCAVRIGARGSLRVPAAVPRAAARDVQAALQRTAELGKGSGRAKGEGAKG